MSDDKIEQAREYRRRAKNNWWFWRPIIHEGGMTLDMASLSTDEVLEYNEALNIHQEEVQKRMQKQKK
ncbi:hypothetical protein SAMN05192534_12370 [Alteribacillus persepolensis]|uniref:Uncharacterized protein n=1 Tax=Alteribacillus persepolensis TaxID=568899 RepID=A0A1G8IAZ7_9BACI|nr:hypothetical protein [Alteribacillus persepolensis]SDI16063.1 hypothetical protein SAMN05192534_12370 [Alteribacillus persepolensis]